MKRTCALTPAALLVAIAGTALGQSTEPFPAQFELSSLLPANGGDGSTGFVLNGIGASDFTGISVSSAGDVNGDGIDDLIIGASNAGRSYVVFGTAGVGSGGVIELASIDGTNGFVLSMGGVSKSGLAVSSAGDINADGIDDLLIGAPGGDPNGKNGAGESHAIFGGASVGSGGVIELSSLNGTDGFVLNGIDQQDMSGISVSLASDINADGIDDLIIGALSADPNGANSGESYVVFGGVGVGSGGVIELSSLPPVVNDPDCGCVFESPPDPASCDPTLSNGNCEGDGSNGFVLNGIEATDYSGVSVSSAGDVNGDGIDDIIVGGNLADPNGIYGAGESHVVFGGAGVGSGGVIELSSLNGTNGFVINGIDVSDVSGRSVSSAGDVNADGIDDLIVGGPFADPNGKSKSGECYVIFGATDLGVGGVIELSSLNGTNGFVLNGIDSNDKSGTSVSSAGDVNGDEIDDLIIGAFNANPNGYIGAGESYVIFGGAGVGSGGVIELSSLDGNNGFVLNGIDAADSCGWSVSSAGDVNGDGIDDLIIGARFADPNLISSAGESYVVFGRNLVLTPCDSDANGNGLVDFADLNVVLGNWLNDYTPGTGPGDVNLDGIVDFTDINGVLGNWLVVCP